MIVMKDGEMEMIDRTIDLKMTKVMKKIIRALKSCKTPEQMEVVAKMVENYSKLYDSKSDHDFMMTAIDIHNRKLRGMDATS